MDRFTSMTLFARVIERGSFVAAAEGSGMSATMVGNHVRELQRHLHGKLINRTTRRQSLTELGKRFHARCVDILALVDSAELDAREMQASPRGRRGRRLRDSSKPGFTPAKQGVGSLRRLTSSERSAACAG